MAEGEPPGRPGQPGHGLLRGADGRGGRVEQVGAGACRRQQHPHRGLGGLQRGLRGVAGAGHAVAHHGHGDRAVGVLHGGDGHGVLVPVVPQAAVAHPGQRPEIQLDVIPADRDPAAARLAVAVGGHRRVRAGRARADGPGLVGGRGRGQLGPAGLAEVVIRADGPPARGAAAVGARALRAGHDQVRGRTSLARSTSSMRRRRSAPAGPGPGSCAPARTAGSARSARSRAARRRTRSPRRRRCSSAARRTSAVSCS